MKAPKWPLLLGALSLLSCLCAAAQQRLEPPGPLEPVPGNPLIRDGDAHYSRRQDKRVGAVADKTEIAAAVRSYDTAAEAPDSAEARWKLARALIFLGRCTDLDASSRQAVFEKARVAAEGAVGILEGRVKRNGGRGFDEMSATDIAEALHKDADAAPAFYWAGVVWQEWALQRGKDEAGKLGAPDKIRKYASVVVALDAHFEDGGGYRLLGRLHDLAPRLSLDTKWSSREEAVRYLRQAEQMSPANFETRLFLAESLSSGSAADKAEAIRIAQRLVGEAPSPSRLVEEIRLQQQAANDLRAWQ